MQITTTFILAAVLALKTGSVVSLPFKIASNSMDARDYFDTALDARALYNEQSVFARDLFDLEDLEVRTTTGGAVTKPVHTSNHQTTHGSTRQSVGSAGTAQKPHKNHASSLAEEQSHINGEEKKMKHDTTHLHLESQIDQDRSELQKGNYRREYIEARTTTGGAVTKPAHTSDRQTTHGSTRQSVGSAGTAQPHKSHASALEDEQSRINSESKKLRHDTTHLHLENQIDHDRGQLQQGNYRREYSDAFIQAREDYFDFLEARTTTGAAVTKPAHTNNRQTAHSSSRQSRGSTGTAQLHHSHASRLEEEQSQVNGESKKLKHDTTHLHLDSQIDQDRSELQKGNY